QHRKEIVRARNFVLTILPIVRAGWLTRKIRGAANGTARPAPARPLATAAAGYDFFVSEARYVSLATRILASLQRGSRIVLVAGDPKPNPRVPSAALTNTAAARYEVAAIACGPEFSGNRLRCT